MYTLSNKFRVKQGDNPEARLVIDFNKAKLGSTKHPFDLKSEPSYNAYLSRNALTLEVKKTNCIAYVDIPKAEYQDHIIDAKISLDNMGGYASCGIFFRILDQESYYMALVSSKGYFRLDVVKDGSPRILIAWTEVENFDLQNIDIKIITYGTYLIFTVNGKWLAEISDNSISYGTIGFAAVNYESGESAESDDDAVKCVCKAHLKYFSVDTRVRSIEQEFKKWTDEANINADSRLRLAETFAVMDKPARALDQINRAWKKRDDVIRGIATTYTEARTKKELLLAARMSFRIGQFNEALGYIDSIIDQWPSDKEGKLAITEKIKILNELDKFEELYDFLEKQADNLEKDIDYYTMYARCSWELKEYQKSADAWLEAFKLNGESGVYAANAANALEALSNESRKSSRSKANLALADELKKKAIALYLESGKIFLRQDNNAELETLVPKLLLIADTNWESHSLAGKWYFSIEDYTRCEKEFNKAEKLRIITKPKPKADPAVYYLWGLVYYIKENRKIAVKLIEKAVRLAPDYELFKQKLDEIKAISN